MSPEDDSQIRDVPRSVDQDPRARIDEAVVSAPATRSRRATRFQWFVLGASAVFVAMAVAARTIPYYAFDLQITHAIQSIRLPWFIELMRALSWTGFSPQVYVMGSAIISAMWFLGLRWEAVVAIFSSVGVFIGNMTKLLVLRPRPTADLVTVPHALTTSSFPSGHVIMAAAFGGYLAFLAFTLLKKSWERTFILSVLAPVILLMGVSRVYVGQHWFSDAIGGYVFGSLWLALSIKLYRWGTPRFFVRQPVAPATAAKT